MMNIYKILIPLNAILIIIVWGAIVKAGKTNSEPGKILKFTGLFLLLTIILLFTGLYFEIMS